MTEMVMELIEAIKEKGASSLSNSAEKQTRKDSKDPGIERQHLLPKAGMENAISTVLGRVAGPWDGGVLAWIQAAPTGFTSLNCKASIHSNHTAPRHSKSSRKPK